MREDLGKDVGNAGLSILMPVEGSTNMCIMVMGGDAENGRTNAWGTESASTVLRCVTERC